MAAWRVPLAEVPFLGDTEASVLLIWMFSPLCFVGFTGRVSRRGVRGQQRSAEGGAAARGRVRGQSQRPTKDSGRQVTTLLGTWGPGTRAVCMLSRCSGLLSPLCLPEAHGGAWLPL